MSLAEYKEVYIHALVVQGLFSGLIGGEMTTGRMKDGLKYSLVMIFSGWIILRFLC